MSFTDYQEKFILQHAYGNVTWTPPSVYYFGMSSTPISDGGTGATEPTDVNYARVGVANGTFSFLYQAGQIVNGTAIQFAAPAADMPEQKYLFISDAPTGGNMRNVGSLSPSQTLQAGQQLRFDIGDLVLTLD